MIEHTCALIKPHAVASGHTGMIIALIELNGFTIKHMEKVTMSQAQAELFYSVHRGKSFFDELVTNITSGPLVAMMLEKENAILDWRELMGATNPAQARPGTIRKMFSTSISYNTVHGSDAPTTAQQELTIFFPNQEAKSK